MPVPDLPTAILDQLTCGVVVHAPDSSITYANKRACELLHLTRDQLYGRTSFHPEWVVLDGSGQPFPPQHHPAVVALKSGEAVEAVEMGVRGTASSPLRWLEVAAAPERGPDGDVARVVVTFTDITARREVQARREEEQMLLAEVLNTVPAGITVVDRDGRVSLRNSEADRLLGFTARTEGDRFDGLLQDASGEPVPTEALPANRVFGGESPLSGARYWWRASDGSARALAINGAMLSGEHSDHAVLAFHDITASEEITAVLRASERRFDSALRAAELGRFEADLDAAELFIDPAWAVRHGLPATWARASFKAWAAVLDDTDRVAARASFVDHLRGVTPRLESEVWVRLPDRRAVRLRVLGQVTRRDASGRATGLDGVMLDVTAEFEQRAARRRLEASSAELARLEGVAAVAGGVAHEFSSLLVGVLGAASELRDSPMPDITREAVELIYESAQQARGLTSQLRAASGRSRFRVGPAELSTVTRAMFPLLRTGIAGQAQLRLSLAPEPLPVEIDKDQLQQVLVNLVCNASEAQQAVKSAEPVVLSTRLAHVGAEPPPGIPSELERPTPGAYAVVSVTDQGEGMAPADVAQMFEPFFSTRAGHPGLGLSAVRGIARGHGGFVTVASAPHKGTEVALWLPVQEGGVPGVVPVRPSPPKPQPADQAAPGPPRTVLVVDDEAIVRRLVGRLLRRSGMLVVEASGGAEALDILAARHHEIDVMLLDLTMPGIRGDEVLAIATDRWPSVPVVVASGYTESELAARLVGLGHAAFLSKPFTADQLVASIERALA